MPSPSSPPSTLAAAERRGVRTRGATMREFAARGVVVNTAFDLGVGGISVVKGLAVAALLTRSNYGLWGILGAALGVLAGVKLIGISDKYVQQDEPDQELAFQRAFTVEFAVSVATMALVACAVPVMCVVYGQWRLAAPGFALLLVLVADALQSPLWVAYRRMDFVRQRSQAAVEPVVGLIVAVTFAALGFGYWAPVLGLIAGGWAAAIVAVKMCPYRLRFRWTRETLRVYSQFSGPMLIAVASGVLLANVATVVVEANFGIAAVGALALTTNVTAFTTKVDDLVANTVFPALCAVQDRIELLRESFVTTNRIALMWAMPFGVGLAVLAPDLIDFVLGRRWQIATRLLQITGLVAAINHVGFNWDDYYRAQGSTRPIAVASVVATAATLGAGIPLLLTDGLTGLGIGIAIGATATMVVRWSYVRTLFPGVRFFAHALHALTPAACGAVCVVLLRWGWGSDPLDADPSVLRAILALLLFAGVTLAASVWFQRSLLRELIGYLRPRPAAAA